MGFPLLKIHRKEQEKNLNSVDRGMPIANMSMGITKHNGHMGPISTWPTSRKSHTNAQNRNEHVRMHIQWILFSHFWADSSLSDLRLGRLHPIIWCLYKFVFWRFCYFFLFVRFLYLHLQKLDVGTYSKPVENNLIKSKNVGTVCFRWDEWDYFAKISHCATEGVTPSQILKLLLGPTVLATDVVAQLFTACSEWIVQGNECNCSVRCWVE